MFQTVGGGVMNIKIIRQFVPRNTMYNALLKPMRTTYPIYIRNKTTTFQCSISLGKTIATNVPSIKNSWRLRVLEKGVRLLGLQKEVSVMG